MYEYANKRKTKVKGKCYVCGKQDYLIVHHILYYPEIVVLVCPSCHYKIHFKPRKIPKDKRMRLLIDWVRTQNRK